MFKDKIYITDRQAFIEWKRNYTTKDGEFFSECYDEEEPRSYPCILLEIEYFNKERQGYDIFYDFVYLTDFISDYGK